MCYISFLIPLRYYYFIIHLTERQSNRYYYNSLTNIKLLYNLFLKMTLIDLIKSDEVKKQIKIRKRISNNLVNWTNKELECNLI